MDYLVRPKWMNQEVYDSVHKNIKDGDELIKDLLDSWIRIEGEPEGGNIARGAKSNLQFILTEDFLMDIEKRENEKGRFSFTPPDMLSVDEKGRLKDTKNGLEISLFKYKENN